MKERKNEGKKESRKEGEEEKYRSIQGRKKTVIRESIVSLTDHRTMGRIHMKSTCIALGYSLVYLLVHSHHSLLPLLIIACCTHLLAHQLDNSLLSLWKQRFSLHNKRANFIQFHPTVPSALGLFIRAFLVVCMWPCVPYMVMCSSIIQSGLFAQESHPFFISPKYPFHISFNRQYLRTIINPTL